jgi:hypothetical protein
MALNGQGNKGPSVAELQRFVRDKAKIAFTLVNGKQKVGLLRWFDESAFGIVDDKEKQITILRTAVMSYQKNDD